MSAPPGCSPERVVINAHLETIADLRAEIARLRAEAKRRGEMLRRADKHIAFALSEYPKDWKSLTDGMLLRDEIEALTDED